MQKSIPKSIKITQNPEDEYENYTKKELIKELCIKKEENKRIWENIKILIAKTSHEMKTPLNSIIGFSELFRYKVEDKQLKEYTTNILKSSTHLLNLAENLIDVAKSQDKPLELSYGIFNTKTVIEDVLQGFYKSDINYTIVDTMISADYMRFKQLIYNLLSNAVKYNKKGASTEVISYVEGNLFCFEVTDFGEGIDNSNIDKIFDIFTQVSEDINKRQIGSGIGLALCKTIVESHNGHIFVNSQKNKGATFGFKIPIRQ